ncbi:hypothetical protein [Hyphococcus luteus]|uniref:Uncharacterized protein n=1 Tax=Hyphococcus luteus TaxID=2058213 RepID=A0A2S7K5Y8_9PROT|nr:hypothetical protein [Marinicaulis flavus]PQA87923.1 hypothetical protein CW354_06145 [Marinicaulis flavus]
MKKNRLVRVGLAALVACIAAGVVAAQERTPPDPEAIQAALREKAKRIPKAGLASALRAAADNRDARATTLVRRPDLEALRAELARTSAADEERSAADLSNLSAVRAPSAAQQRVAPGLRALAPENLRRVAPAEVERALIPVLIPAAAEVRDKIRVYGMENVYTASARIDAEAALSISGTCNRVVGGDPDVIAFRKRLAEQPRRLAGTGAAYFMSRNDFGVDLSFSKFGCGYVITIECGDPGADPRCAEDDYITGLADSMILANPDLAGGE